MKTRQNKRWTEEEIAKVVYMSSKGFSNMEMAERLDRTQAAVQVKLSNLRQQAKLAHDDSEEMRKGDLILPGVCILLMVILAVVNIL
jgi:hypothetical protein